MIQRKSPSSPGWCWLFFQLRIIVQLYWALQIKLWTKTTCEMPFVSGLKENNLISEQNSYGSSLCITLLNRHKICVQLSQFSIKGVTAVATSQFCQILIIISWIPNYYRSFQTFVGCFSVDYTVRKLLLMLFKFLLI